MLWERRGIHQDVLFAKYGERLTFANPRNVDVILETKGSLLIQTTINHSASPANM